MQNLKTKITKLSHRKVLQMEATAKKPSRIEIINNERRILKKLLIDLFCTNNDAEYRKQFRLQIGRKMTM